jgi:hypothetical protein
MHVGSIGTSRDILNANTPAVHPDGGEDGAVLLTGLALICAGLLSLAGFVTCVQRAEHLRADRPPAAWDPPLSIPARGWLAATALLVVAGVGCLFGHTLAVWGLFSR